jgi:flagellar protein FlaG
MVDSTISSAILLIAVIIATAATVNALYPSIFGAASSITAAAGGADSRSKTLVAITAHYFEPGHGTLRIWAKNGGGDRIDGSDLANARIYYGTDAGPLKSYAMSCLIDEPGDGNQDWDPGETLEAWITADPVPHEPGTHRIKLVLPSGATGEYTFAI